MEPPGGHRLGGLGPLRSGSAALGTSRGLVLGRPGRGIGGGLLLDQPGGAVIPALAGAVLALGDGAELSLLLRGEPGIEAGGGLVEPFVAKAVALGGGESGRVQEGMSSGIG